MTEKSPKITHDQIKTATAEYLARGRVIEGHQDETTNQLGRVSINPYLDRLVWNLEGWS